MFVLLDLLYLNEHNRVDYILWQYHIYTTVVVKNGVFAKKRPILLTFLLIINKFFKKGDNVQLTPKVVPKINGGIMTKRDKVRIYVEYTLRMTAKDYLVL